MDKTRQVRIGVHTLNVEFADLDNEFGGFDVGRNRITINRNLNLCRRGETLLHEAGHSFSPTLSDSEVGHALWDVLSADIWAFLWSNNLIHEGNLNSLLED